MNSPRVHIRNCAESSWSNVDITHLAARASIHNFNDDGFTRSGVCNCCREGDVALRAGVAVGQSVATDVENPFCVCHHCVPAATLV